MSMPIAKSRSAFPTRQFLNSIFSHSFEQQASKHYQVLGAPQFEPARRSSFCLFEPFRESRDAVSVTEQKKNTEIERNC